VLSSVNLSLCARTTAIGGGDNDRGNLVPNVAVGDVVE
jgi:hypothetical protein